MREPDGHDQDHDLERAYRSATQAEASSAEGAASAQRRRAQVLGAIERLQADGVPRTDRPPPPLVASAAGAAANEARWAPSRSWWRGAAVASVVVSTALLVMHLHEEPQAPNTSDMRGATRLPASATPPPAEVATVARDAPTGPIVAVPKSPPLATASGGQDPAQAPAANVEAAMAERDKAETIVAPPIAGQRRRSSDMTGRLDVPSAPAQGSLLAAVARGDAAATRAILRHVHPDVERDADGRTALAIATLRSDAALVKLLLAAGADRVAKDRFGKTPLDYAQASGDQALRDAFGNS